MGSLNYLKFLVHRADDRGGLNDVRFALSLIRGDDFFACLETVIEGLRDRGWAVDDLEAFQIGLDENSFGSEEMKELLEMADAGGFAYRIVEAEEFAVAERGMLVRPLGS